MKELSKHPEAVRARKRYMNPEYRRIKNERDRRDYRGKKEKIEKDREFLRTTSTQSWKQL